MYHFIHNILSAWWILVLVERVYFKLTQPSSCVAKSVLSFFTRIMTDNMKNSLIVVIVGRIMTDIMKNSLIVVIVGAMIVVISDNCDDYDDF